MGTATRRKPHLLLVAAVALVSSSGEDTEAQKGSITFPRSHS
ncbi:CNTN2 isoform 34 [Pongo abelii]|uniref:CNTN2 isoform 19 n=1 Tax=Pongo abelii TaxID=9601 RepID=A0A2J8V757_PONAB|nr:CNTN2 isoform 19 [Pongo abelii]PNJ53358.1 CNTN2 isoform 34 [Pongo abelii]